MQIFTSLCKTTKKSSGKNLIIVPKQKYPLKVSKLELPELGLHFAVSFFYDHMA